MKRAFLFPGQGTQVVGMGKDIYETYEVARNIYDKASEISGIDLKKLCFESEPEVLNQTQNTQIAMLTTSLAILAVLKEKGIEAQIATGLSLGEYTALIYAGIISLEEGIQLIQKRGYFMGNLLPKETFSMAAVIGLDSQKIEEICNQIQANGQFVVPANYNCKVQTVISGEEEAVKIASEQLKEAGAKRVIPLKTSGPFHTSKLVDAKKAFEEVLEKIEIREGKDIKVIKNIDGTFYTKQDDIKEILANHMISPVRFDKAIDLMKQEGVDEYIEIGPGKVLTGFIKKDNREANTFGISDVASLESYCNQ